MSQGNQSDPEFQEEYKHIRADVKKVIITNVLILALLVATYFVNKSTGFIDQFLKFF